MKSNNHLSKRRIAIIGGLSIVLMAVMAGFTVGFVQDTLWVTEDPLATATNIKKNEVLFRFGILGWFLILVCDLLASWALYLFLQSVNSSISLLTGWTRFLYTAILGIALGKQIEVLPMLKDIEIFSSQILLSLDGFSAIWSMGLIIFGLHLLGLGYLAWKSSSIPRVISIFLLIASFGYVIIHGGELIFPDFTQAKTTLEMIFMLPMIAGELGLGIWLLVKGR